MNELFWHFFENGSDLVKNSTGFVNFIKCFSFKVLNSFIIELRKCSQIFKIFLHVHNFELLLNILMLGDFFEKVNYLSCNETDLNKDVFW